MDELIEQMKKVLADTFSLYLKAHYYHWNVEGRDFYNFHVFFENLYNELWLASDAIAEHIRALNAYAPGSFRRFAELSSISGEERIIDTLDMVEQLQVDNQTTIVCLKEAYKLADAVGEVGLSNFLQDRIDQHKKHAWMLRATLKRMQDGR
jgi:starvation-inducible DNA-binding protein